MSDENTKPIEVPMRSEEILAYQDLLSLNPKQLLRLDGDNITYLQRIRNGLPSGFDVYSGLGLGNVGPWVGIEHQLEKIRCRTHFESCERLSLILPPKLYLQA